MTPFARRLILAVCVGLTLTPFWFAANEKQKDHITLQGKVVPVADLVKKLGTRLDPDAAPQWLALVTADGKIYPLIKDSGSRMFFKDKRLLNRPVKILGKVLPGSQLLHVVNMHSIKNGKLHEVYYWCDICSIRRLEKNLCDCCGGPMELFEVPVEKK